jgi:hypothetical protein
MPDLYWKKVPKRGEIYQTTPIISKGQKIKEMAVNYAK